MTTFIALLRGINVSGKNKIRMVDLRNLFEKLGCGNVETYIQSGNVVFDCTEEVSTTLTAMLEAAIVNTFGHNVPVFIRAANDFYRILNNNPFTVDELHQTSKLYVTFLYHLPLSTTLDKLAKPGKEAAEFALGTGEIYLFCPAGYGRTKLTNTYFEKILNMPATTRNWRTVNQLFSIASERT